MRIGDILSDTMILPAAVAPDKEAILASLAQRLSGHPSVDASDAQILEGLTAREQLGSTGVGSGVAIPHAKIPGLSQLVGCFARVPAGVEFNSIDKLPAHLIFVLLVPENSAGAHLKALARVSRLLKNAQFRDRLMTLTAVADLHGAFTQEDNRR